MTSSTVSAAGIIALGQSKYITLEYIIPLDRMTGSEIDLHANQTVFLRFLRNINSLFFHRNIRDELKVGKVSKKSQQKQHLEEMEKNTISASRYPDPSMLGYAT